eukprot:CAMPEP_0197857130 /NCGR_PEP_ID=MMETSP1438-20131217/29911_1 /TAXON_ID=1461541 /ORGANISM="Pterosperma sp., Strain CCMP1384" /LENGTH=159 /DNA_ID=CAMNT_0043472845 /DNA_START=421 /DNA_END=897 /DNA_ORIENTATION=+
MDGGDPFLVHTKTVEAVHVSHGSDHRHRYRPSTDKVLAVPKARAFAGVWNRPLPTPRKTGQVQVVGQPTLTTTRGVSTQLADFRYWEPVIDGNNLKPLEPLRTPEEKFVSFEPWHGGFNNIRQSLEIAAVIALASGRTLVFPPKFRMYLRGYSGLDDYF